MNVSIITLPQTLPELDNLINQLETGMKDILNQGDTKRAEKLNQLIGNIINHRFKLIP